MNPRSSTLANFAPAEAHVAEVRKLSTLLEASQALASTPDLKHALQRVVKVLGHHHGALRSMVVLLNEDTGGIELTASAGDIAPNSSVRYDLGEGITGRVVKTGEPLIVPQVNQEPTFLNRAAERPELAHQELSHISVPIALEGRTLGAMSIDLLYKSDRDYHRTAKFLGVVGSMIAQAVKVHRLIRDDRQRLVDKNRHLRQELTERYDFSSIIGSSGPMRQVYEQISRVAGTNTTVLLRGESGTGKELIAHALHYNSRRAKRPFVKVSCAALPQDLLESELFGYEKGAFTGAQGSKKGRFELAHGGTLFLDEIGELSLATQIKLLRVLQEREFESARRHRADSNGHSSRCRYQQGPGTVNRGRRVSRGPLLPSERVHNLRAAAQRAQTGHPSPDRRFCREVRPRTRKRRAPSRDAGD